jgi:dynein heavy chain
LSSYICQMTLFTIEITKNYRFLEFREDIKKLYLLTGCENKNVVFLFNDTQIKDESFLEDINNILSSGTVPNLFAKEDIPGIIDAVRKDAVKNGIDETTDAMWQYFVDRVRSNLHIVLAMSPIGDSLRERCRMYPGLVNSTTIDWFHTWPAEALQEVAMKFLLHVDFEHVEYRAKIATVFADMHLSVITSSNRMLLELKRHNYVTPTNFLELVKGYRTLLATKSGQLGASANKLANGLAKLEDAKEQVEILSKDLEIKKVTVAQSQKSCEDLLVQIVSDRRVADEQKKQVQSDSDRIEIEAAECKAIADAAEEQLAVAMPALEKALAEVDKLDKSSVSEVKAYKSPPPLVEVVMQAVMILFQKPTDWANAKTVLGQSDFLTRVKAFDKDNVSQSINNKIKKFIDRDDFTPESVKKQSGAAAALCIWVHAIYIYANVAKEVAPKRARLKDATDSLVAKQEALAEAKAALSAVEAKLAELQNAYNTSVSEKNELVSTAEMLEAKLDRADKLVNGLEGEYVRWQHSIGVFNESLIKVTGDALIGAAFQSYAGPFEANYRSTLQQAWTQSVHTQELPMSEHFSLTSFLANPTDVRQWQIDGLPRDDFSIENGVISTSGGRWPLMIDPQGQANRWIKNKWGKELKVIDLKMTGFLRDVENAVQYGFPVLLQDILEEMDPALEPVMSRSVMKIGNREVIRLGDKELDYSPDFKLYITTKLANPHYTPEISTKATVVNFAVKKDGLEAQLLGIVVQKEEPSLEERKSELTITVAKNKKQLVDLENEILRLLSESTGSLLDDAELVNTLQASKVTSEEVTAQLKVSEETEIQIDSARAGYRSAAIRASLAYFILDDMSRVDPMYQFSLDSYVDLFNQSIDASKVSGIEIPVHIRCDNVNNFHTLAVYNYTCRGLFEAHKLLFSLQLCFKIMESNNKLPQDEFDYFGVGPGLIDRAMQTPNPAKDWLPDLAWDNITEMDSKVASLSGLTSSVQQNTRDWKTWYLSPSPETETMPGDWSSKTTELQRLCILRGLRIDRVLFGTSKFISANIGPEYVDPPSFDLSAVFQTSNSKTPLIFVLSPGVDPAAGIFQLAAEVNVKFEQVALGQGQAPTAVRLIEEALARGSWVFLANCHLMLSWMPTLEKIIEASLIEKTPHKNFRLWLSSSPDPNFPISILQRGIKMTTEPPKGLRSNLLTLYNTIGETQFNRCSLQSVYKKLLFGLVWFHALLLERRKFKSLGFNIPYDFNESDFAICHDLVIVFLDEYPDRIPFDAMKYLIAEANYGGRVTDDWDRRLVNVYIAELFNDDVVSSERYMLSELPEYFIPEDGDLKHYKDFIRVMPQSDHPAAFGQHSNSDMAASIDDAQNMLSTLVSLAPQKVNTGDEDGANPLVAQCLELKEKTPEPFDKREVRERMDSRSDPDPLKTVLYQEIDRYNKLLETIHNALTTIVKVSEGTASTSAELEDTIVSLLVLKVPRTWAKTYPSMKPLGSWITDLALRIEFFTSWIENGLPKCWWLPALTYPTGFLTAILQVSSRANGVSIDTLSYENPVLQTAMADSIEHPPKEGVYVNGLYLEGATWNFPGGFLEEPRPMELLSFMPIIHFLPVEGKKKTLKGTYSCPVYMYPIRSGSRERPSYVVTVDIKAGRYTSEYWTKRATALLLASGE